MDTNNEDFMNASVNPDHGLQITPPVVQWRRGDLTNENPLLRDGCWQLPVENFQGIVPDNFKVFKLVHSGGKIVESYIMDKIHIAVLFWKKRWYREGPNGPIWMPKDFEYESGIKSRLQVWALIRELDAIPVMVSVAGLNSQSLELAINTFAQKIIIPASRQAKINFARYHFWLPLVAGPTTPARNNQYVTPPVMALADFSVETMRELFVGKLVAGMAELMMPQAEAWAMTQEMELVTPEPPESPDLPPLEDEIPF